VGRRKAPRPFCQIGPDFADGDWTTWFAAYDEQITHYAALAAGAKCEQFSVGCELDSKVGHEAAWRQVIADVRAVYKGKLTYADGQITADPRAVTWWDATAATTSRSSSARSAYAASPARAPWDWQVSGKIDLIGQSRWYQAALKSFAARGWVKGLFLWQWSPDPTVAAPKTTATRPTASRPRSCCAAGSGRCCGRRALTAATLVPYCGAARRRRGLGDHPAGGARCLACWRSFLARSGFRSGDRRGLQNRLRGGAPVLGGFDSHVAPPLLPVLRAAGISQS
jgi:hypothetical protein